MIQVYYHMHLKREEKKMVELENDEVIDGFYAVHTEVGDGYCMAEFIQVTRAEKE